MIANKALDQAKISLCSLFAVLAFCACAGGPSAGPYVRITNPNARIDVSLALVLPPGGSGWSLSRIHAGSVRFGKLGSAPGESFFGLVVLSRLPPLNSREEFQSVVSRQRARDSGDPRFEDIVNDETVSVEDGVWVFRFHMKYKDFGANSVQPGSSYLIVEDYGAVFRHPDHRDVAVTVSLSRRSTPEDSDGAFEKLAADFTGSVEFVEDPAL